MKFRLCWLAFLGATVVGTAHLGTAQIHVNTPLQGVVSNTPQTATLCSFQEAIYATEFGANIALDQTDPDDTYNSGCTDPSGLWYQIVLPGGELDFTHYWDGDGHNPFGPTATPIICGVVQIVGNGTKLVWKGAGHARLFAVGAASIKPTSGVLTTGTYCGIVAPDLTVDNVYVKGFQVKGGDGALASGGGGGLGAGGAVFVGDIPNGGTPSLTIENSTFEGNGATGGNGGCTTVGGGGGGGGLGGNGGELNASADTANAGVGGGGGGSTGNGGHPISSISDAAGGGGGGTVFSGGNAYFDIISGNWIGGAGGLYCGGNGGDSSDNGHNGSCPGGGGGGGGECGSLVCFTEGRSNSNGGNGNYGGGGGGGSGNGGNGGFGGGGGSGDFGVLSVSGGNGGFGGGGGAVSPIDPPPDGASGGSGGPFGGGTAPGYGGGGGALGGAIFSEGATVTIQNSTFYNNSVTGGKGGNPNTVVNADGQTCGYFRQPETPAGNGVGSGGAIFAVNGLLSVVDSTIASNSSTDGGGGIDFYTHNFCDANVCLGGANYFTLDNTIVANNGQTECTVQGHSDLISQYIVGAGNLITANDSQNPCPGFVSMEDPQLSGLANNGGATPTMAIPETSPAFNAADAATSLAADQRSEPRPQLGGYDIGAFEFCRPEFFITPLTAISVQLESYVSRPVTVSSTNCFFHQPVNLAVTGLLGGVLTTFNPAEVTPPVGGSSSSTVQVSLGPAFMPQNFTLTVTGTASTDSGPLAHSVSLNATPVVTAPSIVKVVNQDQTLGCLDNSGISTALNAMLNASQILLSGGHLQGATNVLAAFQLEVQAQAGKHITAGCTDSTGTQFSTPQTLTADAAFLQKTVGSVLAADPIVGSVVNSSNLGIVGATVNLLNSSKTVIATTTTDAVGFYYFADPSIFTPGATYTVKVTIPKGYKSSTPSAQSFTWSSSVVTLTNFVLN